MPRIIEASKESTESHTLQKIQITSKELPALYDTNMWQPRKEGVNFCSTEGSQEQSGLKKSLYKYVSEQIEFQSRD